MRTAKEILDKIKAEKEEKKQNIEEKRKKKVDDLIVYLSDLSEMMYEKSLTEIKTNIDIKVDSIVHEPEIRCWLIKNGFDLYVKYGDDCKYFLSCIK